MKRTNNLTLLKNNNLDQTFKKSLFKGLDRTSIKKLRDYYDSEKYEIDMINAELEVLGQKNHMGFKKELQNLSIDVALNISGIKSKESYRCRKTFKILVVEDELDLRDLYKEFLEDLGFLTVHTAIDGCDAVEQMARYDYDLILSDFFMPNMNGYALYRHIQKVKYETTFVMISGYSDNQFRSLRRSGVFCLPKGIDIFKTLRKVSVGYYLRKLDNDIQAVG